MTTQPEGSEHELQIAVEDPGTPDIAVVLHAHMARMHDETPPEGVFALDVDALRQPGITFYCARTDDGAVLAVAALQHIDETHVEIKSMHTVAAARGRGVARRLLDHLLAAAADQGCDRVSLETGNMDAFAPARRLYERAGFRECELFGPYVGSTTSVCMTRTLETGRGTSPSSPRGGERVD